MSPVTAELCAAKHQMIDEKFEQGTQHFQRLEEKQDKLLWTLLGAMGAILLAIFIFALSIVSEVRSSSIMRNQDNRVTQKGD